MENSIFKGSDAIDLEELRSKQLVLSSESKLCENSESFALDEQQCCDKNSADESSIGTPQFTCSPFEYQGYADKERDDFVADTKAMRRFSTIRAAGDKIMDVVRKKRNERKDARIAELQETNLKLAEEKAAAALEKKVLEEKHNAAAIKNEILEERNAATALERTKLRKILYLVMAIMLVLILSQFAISNSVVNKYTSTKVNSNVSLNMNVYVCC
jgi:hypothetical protein